MSQIFEDLGKFLKRGSLKPVLIASLVSYIGYLMIGVWCLIIELEKAAQKEQEILGINANRKLYPAQELNVTIAVGIIVFAICRLGLLFLLLSSVFFKTDKNKKSLSTFWLAFSTLFMLGMYLFTCIEVKSFYNTHAVLPTVIFVCIALDFVANVFAAFRNSVIKS